MKTLVIVPGLKYYYFNDIDSPDIIVKEEKYLSDCNLFSRCVQRLSKKTNLARIYECCISDWKEDIRRSDRCIIFDQAFSVALVKSLHDINSKLKIYIYCWNPVFKDKQILSKFKKVSSIISVYSFDKNDCKKYGFHFAPMVYKMDYQVADNTDNDYDVIFVGYLKNRGNILKTFYNYLEKNGFNKFFYVIDNVKNEDPVPFDLKTAYMDYKDYKLLLSKSKAVLDITQEGQVGLTIRTLETLCYHKKLITNNADIVNYDFYDSNNIFVIEKDDMNNLKDFLSTPFKPIEGKILKKYNFSDWIDNFNE